MNPFDLMRDMVFLIWRKRPFLFALVTIATVILIAFQYQSITSSNSGHLTSSSSYPAAFSANAEPIRAFHADKNQYNFYSSNDDKPGPYNVRHSPDAIMNDNVFDGRNSNPVDGTVDNSNEVKPNQRLAVNSPTTSQVDYPPFSLVHFDLKGAPPKISYLKQILPIIKQAGANGILLEYEDMFPWNGTLEAVKSPIAYTREQIMELLNLASALKLEVIPLVQTFGHLEYVLKIDKFRNLREVDKFPTAICPSKEESFSLVKTIIDQVMSVHGSTAKWLHIGADEVFHMGHCNLCRLKEHDRIYLDHVTRVVKYVSTKYPQVKPIIWDDMLRNMAPNSLKQLGELGVEPMVWTYVGDIYRFIPYSTWSAFSQAFGNIWAASAFKGAFGETLTVPNVKMHLENNEAWIPVMKDQARSFKSFRGIVVTGWQRYDHLAALCETFPAGLPSLIIDLLTISNGEFDQSIILPKFDKVLRCENSGYRSMFDLDSDPYLWAYASTCNFPGAEIFRLTQKVASEVNNTNNYIYDVTIHKAWMTEYNVRHNITNLARVDEGMMEYESHLYALTSLVREAEDALRQVFDEFTVAEWIEQNIYPYILKLESIKKNAEALRQARVWPVRPLPINKDLADRFMSPPPSY